MDLLTTVDKRNDQKKRVSINYILRTASVSMLPPRTDVSPPLYLSIESTILSRTAVEKSNKAMV